MTGRGCRLRNSRALALAAAVALCASAAAGCGGADGQGQDTGAARVKASAGDQDRGLLRFARCMREHGVDFPDPRRDAGGQLVFDAPAGGDPAALQARAACAATASGRSPTPRPRAVRVLLDPGPGFDPNDPTRKRAVSRCRGLLDLGGSTASP